MERGARRNVAFPLPTSPERISGVGTQKEDKPYVAIPNSSGGTRNGDATGSVAFPLPWERMRGKNKSVNKLNV